MSKRGVAGMLACFSLIFWTGCGSSGSVSGLVTLDGNPLTSGTVTLHPVGSGPVGIGTIGPDGRSTISVGTERSLPAGDYIATVEAFEEVKNEAPPATSTGKGTPPPPKPPRRITPARYADKESSDLKVTIKGGSNDIKLELKSGGLKP